MRQKQVQARQEGQELDDIKCLFEQYIKVLNALPLEHGRVK